MLEPLRWSVLDFLFGCMMASYGRTVMGRARAMTFSKAAVENHVAFSKSLMSSKSVQEVAEKQTEYLKSAFEAYVAEATKVTELMTGMGKEVVAPLNERVTAVSSLMQAGVAR